MSYKLVYEWKYKPENFFEEEFIFNKHGFQFKFLDGTAHAEIDASEYDENITRRELHEIVNDRFLGVQLFTHEPFELTKSTMHRIDTDGNKDTTIFAELDAEIKLSASVDTILKNENGEVIHDSKAERINTKRLFADLVEKHKSTNPLAAHLLGSYHHAVTDPANELIHLYEIRDALSKNFGYGKKARRMLGVSKNEWDKLGELANNEPLKEGRHRGQCVGILRNASNAELNEARNIARSIIRAFLEYIEKN